MPKVRLTTKTVEAARSPAPGVQIDLFDAAMPGFGLRVGDRRKTWFVFYRISGKQKRHTLGHYPPMSLADAREEAGKALEKVEAGHDPAAEREASKAKAKAAQQIKAETGFLPGSFGALATLYIGQECSALRRGPEIERIIHREIMPAWKERPVEELRRRDLTALLDPMLTIGQVQKAIKVRQIALRIINWAVDRGDLEFNLLASPSRGRKRSGILRTTKRDRVLSDDELRDVWNACDGEAGPFGPIVRMLILTGQRREEVGGMRWAELDLDRKLWTIPADRYKTEAPHVVPLSAPAVALLNALPRTSPQFVFATRPNTHFQGYGKCKGRLDERVNAERAKRELPPADGWTLHDLRRTVRTGLSELRVSSDIAERVIGHVIGGVRGVYDRHAYLEDKRAALDLWAARVMSIITPPSDKVISIAGRR